MSKRTSLILLLYSLTFIVVVALCDSSSNNKHHKKHHHSSSSSKKSHRSEERNLGGSVLHEDHELGLCDSPDLLWVGQHRVEKRSSYLPPVTCTKPHETGATGAKASCKPRPRVIRLPWPNTTEVQQMTPSHVVVNRCDGSCFHRKQSCLPKKVKKTIIPVMLGQCSIGIGRCDKICVRVEVEEHTACGCDCKIKRHHCNEKQIYRKQLCSCQCKDLSEVRACYDSGRVWDPSKCMCRCPLSTLQQCSTKFVFDFTNSCKCIPEESNELPGERKERSHELSKKATISATEDRMYKWEILAIGALTLFVLFLLIMVISLARHVHRLKTRLRHSAEVLVPGGVMASSAST